MRKASGSHLLFTIVITTCFLTGIGRADSNWSLKISGGWAYLQAGDVNPGTKAFLDWGRSQFEFTSGEYAELHGGYEIGGDLIFRLGRNFGIGIGAGFLRGAERSQVSCAQSDYGPEAVFTTESTLSATPVRIFVCLARPLNGKIDITANAGISYFAGVRYDAPWQETYSSVALEYRTDITTAAHRPRTPLGLSGGFGLEYHLTTRMAVLLEAQGRWAKLGGLEGTSVADYFEPGGPLTRLFSEEGGLYYEAFPALSGSPRVILIQSAPPAGPDGQPREASVDFSGFSLQAGIRFYF